MARLVWARNQPMVSRYIIACLDRMSWQLARHVQVVTSAAPTDALDYA